MKVFWSRCGHGYGNFGDKLTPLFLDLLKLRYEWAPPEKADLIGIGSLLEKIPDNYKGVIWTTGSMFEVSKHLPEAKVLAVRGNLTLQNLDLGAMQDVARGDGGLLCDLFAEPCKKQFKLGVIPHFVDYQNPAIQEIASRESEICIIDICAPTFEVIQRVAACENIISSSLHGLILADSLGVPNQWIEFSGNAEAISGAGFKFRDYYSNFGLKAVQPLQVTGTETLGSFLSELAQYERPNIATVKRNLIESLERVAAHFGGNAHDRVPLEKLRAQDQKRGAGHHDWNLEVAELIALLEKTIPANERFILIDEEQIRHEVTHAPAIPLIEHDGEYGGAPLNDAHAIAESERQKHSGIRHIAFTNAAFWWLEEHPEFSRWLHENSAVIHDGQSLKVFRFQK